MTYNEATILLKFWFGPIVLGKPALTVLQRTFPRHFLKREHIAPLSLADNAKRLPIYHLSQRLEEKEKPLSCEEGYIRYVLKSYWRRYIDLTVTYDDYLQEFSGKTRSTLKRKERKLRKQYTTVHTVVYTSAREMPEFFGNAIKISQKTYQHKLYEAGIPQADDFQKQAIALADQGNIRAFILYLDQKPVAYLYCPIEDGRVIYGYLGFDPAYSKDSPGTVLQMSAFEVIFDDPKCTMFDFTEGDSSHKRLFGRSAEWCGDVLYFPKSVKGLFIVCVHRFFWCLGDIISAILQKTGLLSKLRKILRGQN